VTDNFFFREGVKIRYVQPPGHQVALGSVGLLAMVVESTPKHPEPLAHYFGCLVFKDLFPLSQGRLSASRSLSRVSFFLRMHLTKETVASQSSLERSMISMKSSLAAQCIVFFIKSNLSRSHSSHTKSVCSASSLSPQYQQRSFCSLPIL
jgi:hypothetical protein